MTVFWQGSVYYWYHENTFRKTGVKKVIWK